MEVDRYWRTFVDGALVTGCPTAKEEEVEKLQYLIDTCARVYEQCGAVASWDRWSRGLPGWLIARHTPACWALCTFGTHGTYVIFELDFGVMWTITSDGELVRVRCAEAENEMKVRELVQQVAKSAKVKVIGLRGVERSKTKATVEVTR